VRFITPDLINLINSTTETTEQIENLWNSRIDELENHYSRISNKLPESVSAFISSHDLLNNSAFSRSVNINDEFLFIIGDFHNKEILFLQYEMFGKIEVENFTGEGFHSGIRPIWLYDEFHVKKSYFEHHIVFNDGISYVIPFKSFIFRKCEWFKD
jgi:hypothetical protein